MDSTLTVNIFLLCGKLSHFSRFTSLPHIFPWELEGLEILVSNRATELLEQDWFGPGLTVQKTRTDGLSGCVDVNSLSFLLMPMWGWNWTEHSGPGSCDDAKWKLLQTEREERKDHICI